MASTSAWSCVCPCLPQRLSVLFKGAFGEQNILNLSKSNSSIVFIVVGTFLALATKPADTVILILL